MTVRRAIRFLLAGGLGAACSLLVACGSSGKGLIPASQAGPLANDFDAVGAAVAATFALSVVCSYFLRTGSSGVAVRMTSAAVTVAFDIGVALTVAHAAFDAGRITVHRVLGAVILYLYIGLIFAGLYRLATYVAPHAFAGLSEGPRRAVKSEQSARAGGQGSTNHLHAGDLGRPARSRTTASRDPALSHLCRGPLSSLRSGSGG